VEVHLSTGRAAADSLQLYNIMNILSAFAGLMRH